MSIRIEISGEIQKENGEKFTAEEKEKFTDSFIAFCEHKKLSFIGITS